MNRFALIALTLSASAHAQWPSHVKTFEPVKGRTVQVKGALENGAPLEDLSWAWNSSNACFPSMQASKFSGHHVFFATQIPRHSVMTITLIPDDAAQNLSLYAYMQGPTFFQLPSALHHCVTCEASHKWDRPWKNKTQDHTRSVEVNAIANPYNVVIGVTGPSAAIKGGFSLEVTVK